MRSKRFCILFVLIGLLGSVVDALTEEPLENVSATTEAEIKVKNPPAELVPAEQLVKVIVESQGHENAGERKVRQFGYAGFGFPPPPPPPYYGGGFGGGGFGGGFQRTRVVTRTRVVNRVRGGGFYGGGGGGGGFFG